MRTPRPLTLASLGLLGLVPTLAGCASAAQAPALDAVTEGAVTEAPMAGMPSADAAPSMSSGMYTDGTYQAQGGYQAPSGPEIIELRITLANSVISEVVVVPTSTNATSVRYQAQFADGVVAETLGKSLDEISVSRVSGSSLTSGGFSEALDSIKADARG